MGWLKQMFDKDENPNLLTMEVERIAMLKWGNAMEGKTELQDIWSKNVDINLPYLRSLGDRVDGVRNIPHVKSKAAIIVGSSPILKDTWHHLKNIDENFVIFGCNSSAKFLIEHGIIPDYVAMIDGQKTEPWDMNLNEHNLKTALLVSPFCEPNTLKNWKGKIYVLPYKLKDEEIETEIRERYGEPMPAGGNSINCMMAFLVTSTQIPIYLMVGNEFSYSEKYYVDKDSRNDLSLYFFATDTKGRRVKTLVPLWEYKIWLENLMWELYRSGYWFCNCSEGILGVDTNGSLMDCVAQVPLDEAIEQVKKAVEFEKQDEITKCKQVYDMLYDKTMYFPENGTVNWCSLLLNIKEGKMKPFVKGLDVGCGTGGGILEALKQGYDVYGADIADNKDIWERMGVVDRCTVAPAHDMPFKDNEFDLIFCADVLEHIPQEWIEKSLEEMKRIGSDRFLFAISNRTASVARGTVQAHHTIASGEWWGSKIQDIGLKIIYFDENDHHAVVIGAIKES